MQCEQLSEAGALDLNGANPQMWPPRASPMVSVPNYMLFLSGLDCPFLWKNPRDGVNIVENTQIAWGDAIPHQNRLWVQLSNPIDSGGSIGNQGDLH